MTTALDSSTSPAAQQPPINTRRADRRTLRHPQFGIGSITWIQGGPNARAKIKFRDVGEKTLVLEYARLTPVG